MLSLGGEAEELASRGLSTVFDRLLSLPPGEGVRFLPHWYELVRVIYSCHSIEESKWQACSVSCLLNFFYLSNPTSFYHAL